MAPQLDMPFVASKRLDDAAVLRRFYAHDQSRGQVELFDHESHDFFPSHLTHAYFDWQIDRDRHHLIEAVAVSSY